MNRESKIFEIAGIGLIAVAMWMALIMLSGTSPPEAYAIFFKGIFGNLNGFMEVFVRATPLIFTSLGCAVTFRASFFNIGAEGQFCIGALASAWAALTRAGIPGAPRILCAVLMESVFGGFWVLIATTFKAKLGTSEIIAIIMLSYIAINLPDTVVRTFPINPTRSTPQSPELDPFVTPHRFLKPIRLRVGFIVAILVVFLVWSILEETTMEYEIKVVGFSKRAVACNGIFAIRSTIVSAFLSDDLAGIVGAVEVTGAQRKLLGEISGERGYTTVLIAPSASNHPLGVFSTAIAFAALEVGANSMQRQMGASSTTVNILVGLIVLLILGRELFYRKKKGERPC